MPFGTLARQVEKLTRRLQAFRKFACKYEKLARFMHVDQACTQFRKLF